MYRLNVTFSPPKKLNNITCGLFTSVGNLLTPFFAVCNNRPVWVIGHAGKRLEITLPSLITSELKGSQNVKEWDVVLSLPPVAICYLLGRIQSYLFSTAIALSGVQ